MNQPTARVIADSIANGVRLTTMEVKIHRFVLAELNTHRVFSRNSASSRAIPIVKQLKRLHTDPMIPVSWPAEQAGMQGGAELADDDAFAAQLVWARARQQAMDHAMMLKNLGLHKSVTNRIIEPYMDHTVVITATAWDNFFNLRLDADAQPEIRRAALAMFEAMDSSVPNELSHDSWHLPYWSTADDRLLEDDIDLSLDDHTLIAARISAARCARVSYLTQSGVRDLHEDLKLYHRLVTIRVREGKGVHWSPLEHVATPWPANVQHYPPIYIGQGEVPHHVDVAHLPCVGNLLKWRSLRTTVEAEIGAHTYS